MRAMNTQAPSSTPTLMQLWRPILAMLIVIVSSNYLVQFPLNDWLTWGVSPFRSPFW